MRYGSEQSDFGTSNHSLSHEGGSERSERRGGREQSEQSGASERVSGASELANGRASGPALEYEFLAVLDHSARKLSARS